MGEILWHVLQMILILYSVMEADIHHSLRNLFGKHILKSEGFQNEQLSLFNLKNSFYYILLSF